MQAFHCSAALSASAGSRCTGAIVEAPRLSCPAARGILPDHRSGARVACVAGRFLPTVPGSPSIGSSRLCQRQLVRLCAGPLLGPTPTVSELAFDPILGAAGVAGWDLSETLPLVFSVWTLGQLPPLWNTGTAIFLPSEAEESPHVIKNFSLPSNLLVFVTPSLVTKLA